MLEELYEILGFNEHAYLPRINLFDEITKLEATLLTQGINHHSTWSLNYMSNYQ